MNVEIVVVWILLSLPNGKPTTKVENFPTQAECNRVLNLIHDEYPGKQLMCLNATIVTHAMK